MIITLKSSPVVARVTPEDIINSQKQAYDQKIKNYSPQNRQKLEQLSKQIATLNKQKSDQLSYIMDVQGAVLEEYKRRHDYKTNAAIDNTSYWVTFAHEAVAYQAAKIYVFDLSSENNLKNDALATINKFESELNYARGTVIKSQKILEDLVSQ